MQMALSLIMVGLLPARSCPLRHGSARLLTDRNQGAPVPHRAGRLRSATFSAALFGGVTLSCCTPLHVRAVAGGGVPGLGRRGTEVLQQKDAHRAGAPTFSAQRVDLPDQAMQV